MRTLLTALTCLMLFATPVVADDRAKGPLLDCHKGVVFPTGPEADAFSMMDQDLCSSGELSTSEFDTLRELELLAESGDSQAQYLLAKVHLWGRDVSSGPAKAVYWLEMAVIQGHAEAQLLLGFLYMQGKGTPTKPLKGIKWISKAADQGVAEGQVFMSFIVHSSLAAKAGLEGSDNPASAGFEWMKKAAEQGYALAQTLLSNSYFRGEGVPKNPSKAAEWLEKAAEQGFVMAQTGLSLAYLEGEVVPKNPSKAAEWAKKAAEQGGAKAQALLGRFYKEGIGVPQDHAEAARWLLKAAEQGISFAKAALGELIPKMVTDTFIRGQGDPQDFASVFKWMKEAAEKGEVHAYGPLSLMYLEGKGTNQDKEEAAYWRDKVISSADWIVLNNFALYLANDPEDDFVWSTQDQAGAEEVMLLAASYSPSRRPWGGAPETSLGWWYLTGKHHPGIPIDDRKALYWNSLGAMDDHPNALTNLALMYATGIGVEQDYGQVMVLLLRAADVFGDTHKQFLDDPDDWPVFTRAEVAPRFIAAHKLYLEAVAEETAAPVSALQAGLVREPPKSIQWGPCQLKRGGYDNDGNWVDLNGNVSAFGLKGAAKECLEQGQIPKVVFDRFMGLGSPSDKVEAVQLKVSFTLENSELIPDFTSIGKAYCQGIHENSLHEDIENAVCVTRLFTTVPNSVSEDELRCRTDEGDIYITLQSLCDEGDTPIR